MNAISEINRWAQINHFSYFENHKFMEDLLRSIYLYNYKDKRTKIFCFKILFCLLKQTFIISFGQCVWCTMIYYYCRTIIQYHYNFVQFFNCQLQRFCENNWKGKQIATILYISASLSHISNCIDSNSHPMYPISVGPKTAWIETIGISRFPMQKSARNLFILANAFARVVAVAATAAAFVRKYTLERRRAYFTTWTFRSAE